MAFGAVLMFEPHIADIPLFRLSLLKGVKTFVKKKFSLLKNLVTFEQKPESQSGFISLARTNLLAEVSIVLC